MVNIFYPSVRDKYTTEGFKAREVVFSSWTYKMSAVDKTARKYLILYARYFWLHIKSTYKGFFDCLVRWRTTASLT